MFISLTFLVLNLSGCATSMLWQNHRTITNARAPQELRGHVYSPGERALFVELRFGDADTTTVLRIAPVAPPGTGLTGRPQALLRQDQSWRFSSPARGEPHADAPEEVDLYARQRTVRYRYGKTWQSVKLPFDGEVTEPSPLETTARVVATPLFFVFDVATLPFWGLFFLPFAFGGFHI